MAENKLAAPASWNDLLNPAYKGMLQMADARTSGTAVTRIFSIIEIFGRDEAKAFDYMKKLRANVQVYTKSGDRADQGRKNPDTARKMIDWASSPAMQSLFAKHKINFPPAHPEVQIEPGLAAVMKGAKIFPIDSKFAGDNRKRVVDLWIQQVLQ